MSSRATSTGGSLPGASRADDGMTLTELLVASALLAVVIAAAYMLMQAASGMVDLTEARSRVTEETRLAMDRMTREVRQAAERPGLEGTGVFSQVSTSQVAFYADIDHEGQLELVTYRRSGRRLLRSITQPTIVDGEYTFGAPGPDEVMVAGLPLDWREPIFAIWSNEATPRELASAQMAAAAAISIHLHDSATVGRRTAVSDTETWIKIRSVYNAVN